MPTTGWLRLKNYEIYGGNEKTEAILPKNEGIANEIYVRAGQERLKSIGKIDSNYFERRMVGKSFPTRPHCPAFVGFIPHSALHRVKCRNAFGILFSP